MAVIATLRKDGAEVQAAPSTNSYRDLAGHVGRLRVAGEVGKRDLGGAWTITFSAGTTSCSTCSKAINAPGTITIN